MSNAPPPPAPPPPPQGPPPGQVPPAGGNWQPQQPPQQGGDWSRVGPKKRKKWPFVLGALVLLLIIVIVATNAGKKSDKTGSGSSSSSSSSSSSGDTHKVGDTAHTGDLDVTLDTVKDPYTPTNEIEKPQAGQRFVAVEMSLKNTASDKKTFSSIIGAELSDADGQHFTIALAGTDLPQLEGDIQAGETRKGWMVFGVPDASNGLKLRVKGDVTSQGSVFTL